jgi:hypothetical protein
MMMMMMMMMMIIIIIIIIINSIFFLFLLTPWRGAGISQWSSAGLRGFESQQGLGIFLFITASIPALGPTQPPIQWVPGALSWGYSGRGVKLTTHLLLVPRSKNAWSYTSTLPILFHDVVLS